MDPFMFIGNYASFVVVIGRARSLLLVVCAESLCAQFLEAVNDPLKLIG